MPSWEQFDTWLGHVASGKLRPKRSADASYDSNYYGYNSSYGGYYDDYDSYHLARSLEDQDYFTSVDVLANKFRRQGLFNANNLVFNVPQSILPDAILRVAALGPIVTFAYAFATDWQMATDIQNLKKRVEDFSGGSVNDQAKAICKKVTEITSLQGCSAAAGGCFDEVAEPPATGATNKWFPQGSDLINKLLAVGDLPCDF